MTTLKEEIQEEYTRAILSIINSQQIDLLFTSKILKLIEERIDELLKQSNKYEWVNALMRVKEMLQK
jgi:hypothetical protein